jgi:hypothetical protein
MKKQFNLAAVCVFTAFAVGAIVMPVLCDEIIEIEHQVILTKKPDKIVSAEFWIPTNQQTAQALRAINKYLEKLSGAKKEDMLKPTTQNSLAPTESQISKIRNFLWKYRVQFMGINFDNRKAIYCNFFTYDRKKFAKWKSEYVDVSTGGNAFWQIDYDVNTKECSDLTINSEDLKANVKK